MKNIILTLALTSLNVIAQQFDPGGGPTFTNGYTISLPVDDATLTFLVILKAQDTNSIKVDFDTFAATVLKVFVSGQSPPMQALQQRQQSLQQKLSDPDYLSKAETAVKAREDERKVEPLPTKPEDIKPSPVDPVGPVEAKKKPVK